MWLSSIHIANHEIRARKVIGRREGQFHPGEALAVWRGEWLSLRFQRIASSRARHQLMGVRAVDIHYPEIGTVHEIDHLIGGGPDRGTDARREGRWCEIVGVDYFAVSTRRIEDDQRVGRFALLGGDDVLSIVRECSLRDRSVWCGGRECRGAAVSLVDNRDRQGTLAARDEEAAAIV